MTGNFFDDQRKLAAQRAVPGGRRPRGEAPGQDLPFFERDPDGAEERSRWVRTLDEEGAPAPAYTVVFDGELYRMALVPDGTLGPVEDAAPVGCGKEWFGVEDPPGGKWMIRNGRRLEQAEYPELFAVIGTIWNTGGEGPTQFRIPDRRGRVGVGAGQGPGLTNRPLGSRFGEEEHTLTVTEMPAHSHGGSTGSGGAHNHGGSTGQAGGHSHGGSTGSAGAHSHSYPNAGGILPVGTGQGNAANALPGNTGSEAGHDHAITSVGDHGHAVPNQAGHDHAVTSQGGGQAHENMPPAIAENHIIRVRP